MIHFIYFIVWGQTGVSNMDWLEHKQWTAYLHSEWFFIRILDFVIEFFGQAFGLR